MKNNREAGLLKGIPIFKVGKWKEKDFTIADLEEIANNTNKLINSNLHEPPLKIGHSDNQELVAIEGMPAIGWAFNIQRVGDQLFADASDVPDKVLECIRRRNYKHISSEIYEQFEHPQTKEKMGKVLRAIALLGADIPEVKGLGDINKLYAENKVTLNHFIFAEDSLTEVNFMNMWSLSDVKKYFPCCTEAVEKYFKEAKKETIGQDKLAEIIAQVRVKQYTEAGANAEPECPPEFKWNEELSRCVESSGAPDTTGSRQVCPKGMKWDDKTQKCVVVTAEAAQTPPAPASTQPAEMPDDEWLNGIGKKKLEEMTDDEKKKSVKIIGEKIKTLTAEEQEKIKKVELQANPGDGRPPKEWWNRCVAGPGAGATDPASYCGFLWHKVVVEKGATPASVAAEPPATPAATTAPTVTTSEEDKKKIESLAEQVKKLENEKKAEAIKKLKDDNRNILLPKFDDQIDMIFKEIDSQKLIKFGETETSLFDLFYGLLKDISKNKAVIFAEMVKTPGEGTEMKLTEDDNKQIEKNKTRYAEIKPGEAIENDELAIFAEKIAEQQKISYTEALVQASKLLRERK